MLIGHIRQRTKKHIQKEQPLVIWAQAFAPTFFAMSITSLISSVPYPVSKQYRSVYFFQSNGGKKYFHSLKNHKKTKFLLLLLEVVIANVSPLSKKECSFELDFMTTFQQWNEIALCLLSQYLVYIQFDICRYAKCANGDNMSIPLIPTDRCDGLSHFLAWANPVISIGAMNGSACSWGIWYAKPSKKSCRSYFIGYIGHQ